METKHTPTPWVAEGSIYENMVAAIRSVPDLNPVAHVWETKESDAGFANANFIILACNAHNGWDAVNELLQMIEAYDLESELDAGEDELGPVKLVRAALAKARGKA